MAPLGGHGRARGRVIGRGGYRGRGRGGRNTGRNGKRGFPAAKLDVTDPAAITTSFVARSQSPTPEPESELSGLSDDGSSGDEEHLPIGSAYQELLRSYQNHTPKDKPRRKRQKTEHITTAWDGPEESSADEAEAESAMAVDQHQPLELADMAFGDEQDDLACHDPFLVHFADPDENELSLRLQAIAQNKWATERFSPTTGGRCVLQVPDTGRKSSLRSKLRSTRDINIKARLEAKAQTIIGEFSELEQVVAPSIFEYQDVLFGARTVENASRLRHISSLHALNHIFKTRDRVIKNNDKLARATSDVDLEFRDQGFTRPKVLFLLETKQACVRLVESMAQICDFEQQENKKRFLDSFSLPEDKFTDDRPEDFRELFDGNDDNEFRIGMKFTRKTLKFYSKFYNSDVILASPLGLRRAIESGDSKKKDCDFLSSIELVVMEQADATLMQNWEHAEYVFEHLNLQPNDAHDCDFSRVRSWYLDGHAANLRQTIVLSAYLSPKINTLYGKHMRNVAGRLKYTADHSGGAIETLNFGIKQTFSRFESPHHTSDPDARFKFFASSFLPQLTRLPKPVNGGLGVLIFIPSYLDFVRVRNFLVDSDFSYASISEYTDATNVRKARSHFMSGRHSVLLYTGRAHHFHRYNMRGVKRVIFYGIPENVAFYKEAVGFVGKTIERGEASKAETSIRVAFSKWEKMELEQVVGTQRVAKMIADKGDVFDFV